MMIAVGVWACFQFGPSVSQFMLPFVKVAALAIIALVCFLALGFRADQKSVATIAESAIAPLFGLAVLAIVVGFLLGKVNGVFANLQNLLSL